MYRIIDCAFWTDPKIRLLNAECKLLFLYLITNPHTHLSGIYYLPPEVIVKEMAIGAKRIRSSMEKLQNDGLVKLDEPKNVVWVVNMMLRQGKGEKNLRATGIHVSNSLHFSELILDFLDKYPEVYKYISPKTDMFYKNTERLIRYPAQDSDENLRRIGYPEFAIEKEQNKEQEQNNNSSEPCSAQNSELPFLIFPCVGSGPKEWPLYEAKVAEYVASFPGVDVRTECRNALQWCRDNPARRKTYKGLAAFLTRWLSKHQDQGSLKGPVISARKAPVYPKLNELEKSGLLG